MSDNNEKFKVKHLSSNQEGVKPDVSEVEYGEIAVNYNEEKPFIAFKTSGESGDSIVTTVTQAKFDAEHGLQEPYVEDGVLVIPIPPGAQGPMGRRGPQGAIGPQGEQGVEGVQGLCGEKGPQGEAGPQGEQGERGPQGFAGNSGQKGPQGERGDDGLRGPQGEIGERGAMGERGNIGD